MRKTGALYGIVFCALALFLVSVTANPALAQSCLIPPAGMVGWWPGDGNANDIAGANNGTSVGGVNFVLGKVGQGFNLGGTNFVQVADDPTLNPLSFTIDAWVKTTFLPSPYSAHFIVAKSGSDGYHGYELGTTTTGRVRFTVLAGGSPYGDAFGTTLVADGQWHHIAATYNGTNLIVYVDGAVDATVAYTGGVSYIASSPLYVGKRQYAGIPGYFHGEIDEVEIFNRALSAAEISTIHSIGSVGKCKAQATIDIKPGSFPNSINLGSAGVIPVAIFSTATFDATTLDPMTLDLNGAEVKIVGRKDVRPLCHVEDVNGDLLADLVCQVSTFGFIVEPGSAMATLKARTYDGIWVWGEDVIEIVP